MEKDNRDPIAWAEGNNIKMSACPVSALFTPLLTAEGTERRGETVSSMATPDRTLAKGILNQ